MAADVRSERIADHLGAVYGDERKDKILRLGRWARESDANLGLEDMEETEVYHGVGLYNLALDLGGEEAAKMTFMREGRRAFLPVDFFERVIKCGAHSLCLTTNSPRSERAAALAAEKRAIPSIAVVDALSESVHFKLPHRKCCVMADVVKRDLIEKDLASSVVVTGSPMFEKMAKAFKPRPRFDIGIPTQPGWEPEDVAQIVKGLKRLDFSVSVRVHPSQNAESFRSFSGMKETLFSEKETVSEWLGSIRSLVGWASTTLLEAAVVGVPVYIFWHRHHTVDFSHYGVGAKFEKVEDLIAAVVSGQNLIPARSEASNFNKANATENVVKEVMSLLATHGRGQGNQIRSG